MSVYPSLEITTCHQYKIHHPFRWRCVECGREYGRHTNSIDVSRQLCGICKGRLEPLGRFNPDGTPAAKRKASGFSLFVAANFSETKAGLPPGSSHAEVMRALSSKWREQRHGDAAAAEI
uniref:Sprt-like metalloprotease n=1 Tax=Tetraselmis sp. GSL018 TaxID=582737 RepID=A0A061R9L5_9CHLO|mmetsp:Transcript_37843/g.89856  ORF Transcript_37843/g.89856 Transcript_37843/m.89856 type:complete len:120 (-) Transcript_37843:334-693(-)